MNFPKKFPKLYSLLYHLNIQLIFPFGGITYKFTLIGNNKGDDGEKSQHPAPERHGDQGGTELSCQLRIASSLKGVCRNINKHIKELLGAAQLEALGKLMSF